MYSHNLLLTHEFDQCIFLNLYEQCNCTSPDAMLSPSLRNRLEQLPKSIRKGVASMVKDGCTPLFLACKRGHVNIVNYLITVCGVDIEQRCTFELPDTRNDRCVTPLWCAAISGKLPVAMCLVAHGADINAVSDTGSTPVASACFMTCISIVHFLVEQGADIQKGNYCGVTCLINSVKSKELCLYLLKRGADINARDVQDKTALHYAIQEEQFDTTKLLIEHGADPHIRTRCGDDALQTACLKGNRNIFEYLVSNVRYPPSRLADAYEVMGSTLLEEFNNIEGALDCWRAAVNVRTSVFPPLKKLPVLLPRAEYRFAREFISMNELDTMADDLHALRIQSLLICERVLGSHHRNVMFRLKYRGADYVDSRRYENGLELWKRALRIRIDNDSILFADTSTTAQAIVHLYLDLKVMSEKRKANNLAPDFQDIVNTFEMLANALPEAARLLEIHPIYKKQQENFDRILRCITHLMYLLHETAKTREEKIVVRALVTKVIDQNPTSSIHGDTLLHLCVSRLNTLNETYFKDDNLVIFPNLSVIKLLLECGALINATNNSGATPLHVAANTYNFCPSMVGFLLDNGAHLDKPNHKGECPKNLLTRNHTSFHLIPYVTLKCLAATVIVQNKIPYNDIPIILRNFIAYHEP